MRRTTSAVVPLLRSLFGRNDVPQCPDRSKRAAVGNVLLYYY